MNLSTANALVAAAPALAGAMATEGTCCSIKELFTAEMERRFGSEEAIGVYFTFEDGDHKMTGAEVDAILKHLGDDAPGMISYLPHGGSAVVCTEYACHIYRALPGRVQIFGFDCDDNPGSRIAQEDSAEGHDFAVLDDRFIVDPWPRLVEDRGYEKLVHDLHDPVDAAEALDYFGPRACWTRQIQVEQYAIERAAV